MSRCSEDKWRAKWTWGVFVPALSISQMPIMLPWGRVGAAFFFLKSSSLGSQVTSQGLHESWVLPPSSSTHINFEVGKKWQPPPLGKQAGWLVLPSPLTRCTQSKVNGIKMELAGEREPCGDQAAHLLSLRLLSSLIQLWAHPSGYFCLKRTEGRRGTEVRSPLSLTLLLRGPWEGAAISPVKVVIRREKSGFMLIDRIA